MKTIERYALIGGICACFALAAQAQSPEGAPLPLPKLPQAAPVAPADDLDFGVSDRFTAQRRPRLAVWEFEDSNAQAREARYGDSVEAMLVTFLKRKSQLVVVERQHLGGIYEEWQRMQKGRISLEPQDVANRQLLERLDAFVHGSVTVLDVQTELATAPTQAEKEPHQDGKDLLREVRSRAGASADAAASQPARKIHGPRIEVDAKLLSRSDGRIIAAAQRSGPVACLRSIVERLGVALEQEYLRPYHGRLRLTLEEPSHVHIFLTPILLDTALDEEKPPVERGTTIRIGASTDVIEPWITNSTSYTIENLLSGWYSMRLERPGYQPIGTDNARWEARDLFGRLQVYDRQSGRPLGRSGEGKQFVVRVEPLSSLPEVVDGNELGLAFRKLTGSLAPRVKRQYVDKDFSHKPERVVLIGGRDLDINPVHSVDEFADDLGCDLFDEIKGLPSDPSYGRTYVAAGQRFDIGSFTGGELIIEDYQGEPVPAGKYRMDLWEPNYEPVSLDLHHDEDAPTDARGSAPKPKDERVAVRDGDDQQLTRAELTRKTLPLELETTGEKRSYEAIVAGRETAHRVPVALDFSGTTEQPGLPVDEFTVSTDVPGLEGWRDNVTLLPPVGSPPVYDVRSEQDKPRFVEKPVKAAVTENRRSVIVKTRLAVAGRLDAFSKRPDPLAADLHVDEDVLHILNLLLYGQEERPEKGRGRLLELVSGVGRAALETIAKEGLPPGTEENDTTRALVALAKLATAPQPAAAPGTSPPTGGAGAAPPADQTQMLLQLLAQAPAASGEQGGDAAVNPLLAALAAALNAAPGSPGAASGLGSSAASGGLGAAPPPPSPSRPRFPDDREELEALLARRLKVIDLLVLDAQDMGELRKSREVALIVQQYVTGGGALFGFVSDIGDYGEVVGAPLAIQTVGKPTGRFELAVGEVPGIVPRLDRKKKLDVKGSRALPELPKLRPGGPWRVVAFTQGQKHPRILERGKREEGGYVLLWLDDPETFRGRRMGGSVPEVEQTRANLEERVLDWARYLMYRRYDSAGEQRRRAEQALTR